MLTEQAAKYLGISKRQVVNLCSTGRLPGAYKHGRDWEIPQGSVEMEYRRRATRHSPGTFYVELTIDKQRVTRQVLASSRGMARGEICKVFHLPFTYPMLIMRIKE